MAEPMITAPIIPATAGFEVESIVLGPEQLVSATYGITNYVNGEELPLSPEQEAHFEAERAEIREKQLHRFRVRMTCTLDGTFKAIQTHAFPPSEANKESTSTINAALKTMKQKAEDIS